MTSAATIARPRPAMRILAAARIHLRGGSSIVRGLGATLAGWASGLCGSGAAVLVERYRVRRVFAFHGLGRKWRWRRAFFRIVAPRRGVRAPPMPPAGSVRSCSFGIAACSG